VNKLFSLFGLYELNHTLLVNCGLATSSSLTMELNLVALFRSLVKSAKKMKFRLMRLI